MAAPKTPPRLVPADDFAASTAAPGLFPCKHRSRDPPCGRVVPSGFGWWSLPEPGRAANDASRPLGLPLVLAAPPAAAARPAALACRSPAAHPAGALCFTSSETYGSEGVRCGAVGRERCGTVEGGASRFVAVTGGPVKPVTRHEPTKTGRGTAVSRRETRRPRLGTVPSTGGRG